jgi:hypothetical protein
MQYARQTAAIMRARAASSTGTPRYAALRHENPLTSS